MGYMGFGMRKEVFTRKPKKAFKKLKELYEGNSRSTSAISPTNYNELKIFRKRRFRHFSETKAFRFLLLLGFAILIIFSSWRLYFQKVYFQYKQSIFEKEGIVEYVDFHKKEIIIAKEFFEQRENKILSIEKEFLIGYTLSISSSRLDKQLPPGTLYRTRSMDDTGYQIRDSSLIITKEGYLPQIYHENWLYIVPLKDEKAFSNSVLTYIASSYIELKTLLIIVKRNNWKLRNISGGVQLTFSHPDFQEYVLQFSKDKPKPPSYKMPGTQHITGTIKPHEIYWIRGK